MYEEVVKEFNSIKLELERGVDRVEKVFIDKKDKEENARINKELQISKFKIMDINDVIKLTGVKNGRIKSRK